MATPHSPQISISEQEKAVLLKITRQTTADFREVCRGRLILEIGKGQPNAKIAQAFNCGVRKVRHWRNKWLKHQATLKQIEADPEKNKHLEKIIRGILSDDPRSGTGHINFLGRG